MENEIKILKKHEDIIKTLRENIKKSKIGLDYFVEKLKNAEDIFWGFFTKYYNLEKTSQYQYNAEKKILIKINDKNYIEFRNLVKKWLEFMEKNPNLKNLL